MQAAAPQDHFVAAQLRADGLACRRGDRLLFAGLSLTLGAGDALHVIGPNGIGKSSLLRILAGLLRPYAGTVERGGGGVGLLDERPALDPQVTLGRALAFWCRVDGIGAPDAAALGRLGLADLLDVPVRYLSTGQAKRAGMARLVGQRAAIWLLDEPLNGLDTVAVGVFETLIAEHLVSGGVCVIASHQPVTLADCRPLDLQAYGEAIAPT